MKQVIAIILIILLSTGNLIGSVIPTMLKSTQPQSYYITDWGQRYIHNYKNGYIILAQVGEPVSPSPVFTMSEGYMAGRITAEGRSTTGSFVGGLFCGMLTGLIGTGILWGVTQGDDVPIQFISTYQGKGTDYSMGFINGYRERTKEKKRGARLGGGLLGTAAFLVFFLSGSE
ncbi:hypothetical protein ACFL55_01810 [Candidatus Latescibacterota bacterium]